MKNKIELGMTVKCMITGFTGVVSGHAKYLTGCDQFCIQPKCKKNDSAFPDNAWLDENRLKIVSKTKVKIQNTKDVGCDIKPPLKR